MQSTKSAGVDQTKQIEDLKQKLAAAEEKAKDYGTSCREYFGTLLNPFRTEIVKKQAEQNAREYDRLATEFNAKTGAISDKRKD